MNNATGFVSPATTVGSAPIVIRPRRGFFPATGKPIIAHAVIEELHHHALEITDHPIEKNASVSDHAYKRPVEVVIRCGWSNSTPADGNAARNGAARPAGTISQSTLSGNAPNQVRDIFRQLIALQESREPFDIYTGKQVYKNMLLQSLTHRTDKSSENSLPIVAVCRQIIRVSIDTASVASINPNAQAFPQDTTPVQDVGHQQLQPARNYSPIR